MADVFKEFSVKDKGAAKSGARASGRSQTQPKARRAAGRGVGCAGPSLAGHLAKLNIADALAWQRDAAKAGAPLSKEPLADAENPTGRARARGIEDLQHHVQVQREAAVLLAQRIEVLSTKPWRDAQAAWDTLRTDVEHWQTQGGQLVADSNWASVDLKFPPLLEASKSAIAGGVGCISGRFVAWPWQLRKMPQPPIRRCPCGPTRLRQARGMCPRGSSQAGQTQD